MTTRILLSAFEPFGDNDVNSSAEVARTLAGRSFEDFALAAIVLPTERYEAPRQLVDLFEYLKPDAVLMLGIAADRDRMTPERVALNVDDYRIPDNRGSQPIDEPIIADAPAAYFSRLPVKRIAAAIDDLGIPASVSNTAGTYLCNHTSFVFLHHLARTDSRAHAGFMHIPQMSEAVDPGRPSLPFEALLRGVEQALRVVARTRAENPARRT